MTGRRRENCVKPDVTSSFVSFRREDFVEKTPSGWQLGQVDVSAGKTASSSV